MCTKQESKRLKYGPCLSIAIGVVLIICLIFIIEIYVVDGDSMATTLFPGDVVLCIKVIHLFLNNSSLRDNIFILKHPVIDQFIIKRVIAHTADTLLMYNDKIIVENNAIHNTYQLSKHINQLDTTIYYPIRNTENCTMLVLQTKRKDILNQPLISSVYILGDNTSNSLDSRLLGPINKENIIARIICVLHSSKSH